MLCLIFDIDDTIVEYVDFDFREWYEFVAKRAADSLGIPMDFETWRGMISGRISRRYVEKFGVPAKSFWKEVDGNNLEYRRMMLSSGRLRLYDDCEAIKELPGKKIAWSASSSECVRFVLGKLGATRLFSAIYGKDYRDYAFLDEMKPRPGLLREIIRQERCSECYVIGDSLRDMRAAEGAGCTGILVDRRGVKEYERKIKTLLELTRIIR